MEHKEEEDFTIHRIYLPEDDFDENDELDEKIRRVEKAKKSQASRGKFYGV